MRILKKLIICLIGFFVIVGGYNMIPKGRITSRTVSGIDSCRYDYRVLLGAIEMYNIDHSEKLNYVDGDVIQKLVDENYLKSKVPIIPNKDSDRVKCKYLSKGDLTEDGIIYCTYHGSFDNATRNAKPTILPSKEYERDEEIKSFNKWWKESKVAVAIFIVFAIIVLIS